MEWRTNGKKGRDRSQDRDSIKGRKDRGLTNSGFLNTRGEQAIGNRVFLSIILFTTPPISPAISRPITIDIWDLSPLTPQEPVAVYTSGMVPCMTEKDIAPGSVAASGDFYYQLGWVTHEPPKPSPPPPPQLQTGHSRLHCGLGHQQPLLCPNLLIVSLEMESEHRASHPWCSLSKVPLEEFQKGPHPLSPHILSLTWIGFLRKLRTRRRGRFSMYSISPSSAICLIKETKYYQ